MGDHKSRLFFALRNAIIRADREPGFRRVALKEPNAVLMDFLKEERGTSPCAQFIAAGSWCHRIPLLPGESPSFTSLFPAAPESLSGNGPPAEPDAAGAPGLHWSRFNRLFSGPQGGGILYNALSNTMFFIPLELTDALKTVASGEGASPILGYPALLLQLRLSLCLLSREEEEIRLDAIRLKRRLSVCGTHELGLTIAPTLACDLACPYCYFRDRSASTMDDDTARGLINFAERFSHVTRRVKVTWYGGEPLLAFARLRSLSRALMEAFGAYEAKLLTNGYGLSPKIIDQLSGLGIKSVQITLDGTAHSHDRKRRHRSAGATYDTILGNLDILLDRWDGDVRLRVNIENDAPREYDRLREALGQRLAEPNFFVYPAFITGENRHGCGAGGCDDASLAKADFWLDAYRRYGAPPPRFPPFAGDFGCLANHHAGFVVGPDGSLYKCHHDLGDPTRCIGSVFKRSMENTALVTRYEARTDPFDIRHCQNCDLLPVCPGGCARTRIDLLAAGAPLPSCPPTMGALEALLRIFCERALASKKHASNLA